MSVFTSVSRKQLETYLATTDVGELVSFAGTSEGIDNTNYFVTTHRGDYVLTLFEHTPDNELPYILGLTSFLSQQGLPCAVPQPHHDGAVINILAGRPAVLVNRLPGASIMEPAPDHCAAVGSTLGKLHLAGLGYGPQRHNTLGLEWMREGFETLKPRISSQVADLLAQEVNMLLSRPLDGLPVGTIHADLFRDNVLFDNNALSGVVDFNYACHGALLIDLAITFNDWCLTSRGAPEKPRAEALLKGYHQIRPLSDCEIPAWPAALRFGALRFWISRLLSTHFPQTGEILKNKDPEEFQTIVTHHQQSESLLLELLKNSLALTR